MIRDIVRAALVVATLAACAAIVLEARERLMVMEHAGRLMASHSAPAAYAAPATATPPKPEGRLRGFGRAALDFADAAMNVVR